MPFFLRVSGNKKSARIGADFCINYKDLPDKLHRLDGFVLRCINREYARKSGYFKNLFYVLAESRKGDFARNLFELFRGRKKDAQSRAADIFKFTTFDEHLRLLFFKQFCKYLFKFGGRCDIESAFKGYNSNVVYFFLANFHI